MDQPKPVNTSDSISKDIFAALLMVSILAVAAAGLASHHYLIFWFALTLSGLLIAAFAIMRLLKVW